MNIIKSAKSLKTDWKNIILSYPKLASIQTEITKRAETGITIFPPEKHVFEAFKQFNIAETKVVILGQDCYHTPDVANGMAFSTSPDKQIPPSLRNIYAEIKKSYT